MARYISLLSLTWRKPPRESGQAVIVAALLLPILLGMAGMAVDVGGYASDRRQLQNAADSIALAAAQDLPDATAATTSAQSWAAKNNVSWEDVDFSVIPQDEDNPNPKVVVDIERSHKFAFMQVLGLGSRDVSAHAAAVKTSPGGMGGLTPLAIVAPLPAPGTTVPIKLDASGGCQTLAPGNCLAIRIDGNGSQYYQQDLTYGSTATVCAQGVANCTGTAPTKACPTSSTCNPENGNLVSATNIGVNYRLTNTDPHCSSFSQVFTSLPDGTYHLVSQCNPWLPGSYRSLQVLVVPVVTGFSNGNSNPVTIVSFALLWLNGFTNGGCSGGNSCQVQGTFVNANLTVNALAGVYDPTSSIHFTRLTE